MWSVALILCFVSAVSANGNIDFYSGTVSTDLYDYSLAGNTVLDSLYQTFNTTGILAAGTLLLAAGGKFPLLFYSSDAILRNSTVEIVLIQFVFSLCPATRAHQAKTFKKYIFSELNFLFHFRSVSHHPNACTLRAPLPIPRLQDQPAQPRRRHQQQLRAHPQPPHTHR